MQIQVGELKLWRAEDGELHWFAAEDEDKLKELYHKSLKDMGTTPEEMGEVEFFPEDRDLEVMDETLPVEGVVYRKMSEIMRSLEGIGSPISSTLF